MSENFYKDLIEECPLGFACHEVIFDDYARPVDYVFLETNTAFENLTGLKKEDITGKKVTKVLPDLKKEGFDWIAYFGKIAQTGGREEFSKYSFPLKKWFKGIAYSTEKNKIITFFTESTQEIEKINTLEKLSEISEELFSWESDSLSYKKITDNIRNLSGARFAAFNLYESDGKSFTTLYISEEKSFLKKASDISGMVFENKKWTHDNSRAEKIKDNTITVFDSLKDLTGNVISGKIVSAIEKIAGTGEAVIIKITRNNIMLGDFTLIMDKGIKFRNYYSTEIYARQVGFLIERINSGNKLMKKQEELDRYFSSSLDLLCIADTAGIFKRINPQWEEVLGYRIDELEGARFFDFVHPEDLEATKEALSKLKNQKEVKSFTNRYRCKSGEYRYIEWRSKPQGNMIYAVARDITKRVKDEKRLEVINRNQKILIEVSGMLINANMNNLQELINETMGKIARVVHADRAYVFSYDFEKNICNNTHEWCAKGITSEIYNLQNVPVEDMKEWETAHRKNRPVIIDDVSSMPEDDSVRKILEAQNIKSVISIPLFFSGNLYGFIGFDSVREKFRYREEEKNILIQYGNSLLATIKRVDSEVSLKQSEEKNKFIVDNISDIVWIMDPDFHTSYISDSVMKNLGYTPEEYIKLELKDKHPGSSIEKIKKITEEEIKTEKTKKDLRRSRIVQFEHFTKSGKRKWLSANISFIRDENNNITGIMGVSRDITETKKYQEQVEFLSYYDHLTGLYNRRYLENLIPETDTKENLPLAVMVIDINGLKLTNDSFGHDMGDALIKTVAEILKKCCGKKDIIARTGGDEFMILLPRTGPQKAQELKKTIIDIAENTRIESIIISLAIGSDVKTEMSQRLWDVMKKADNRMYENKLKYGKLMKNKTIEVVLRNINNKYDKEQIHTEMVTKYCESIAKKIGLTAEETEEIKTAGAVHDIGKITVSPDILNKSEKLTPEEWEEIKRHPVTGHNILKGVDEYSSFANTILHHHERYDGSGYPHGLKGKEIPLYSRIIAVADAYEAMTSIRAYQKTLTKKEAIEELKKCSGSQFDPEIVDAFISCL